MTQCMANEEFHFYMNDGICDTKIYFEDWEDNSPMAWTDTTQFDTVEECCANEFWFEFDDCIARSPVVFKFEFCVDIKGLVDPQDCQSADIYANVLEDAINEGCYHAHGLGDVDFHPVDSGRRVQTDEEDPYWGDITTTDANITKIGGVSLTKVSGSTVCGGSLGGQGFINDLTGTMPDINAASDTSVTVCGVITVEERDCKDEECLHDHYDAVKAELAEFTNNGDLTLAIYRRSGSRLPPVPELQAVTAVNGTMHAYNLLLPATITGDLDLKFYHGADAVSCMEKVVFQPGETPYDTLDECCSNHYGWDVEGCCQKMGGCPTLGIAGIDAADDSSQQAAIPNERWYPSWTGTMCSKKANFDSWEQNYGTLNKCCSAHFSGDVQNCVGEH